MNSIQNHLVIYIVQMQVSNARLSRHNQRIYRTRTQEIPQHPGQVVLEWLSRLQNY